MPGRVFVTHEPMRKNPATGEFERTRDISAARQYGDLVHVFPAGHLSQDPAYIMACAKDKMADYSDDDFLLLSGDTLAIAACSMVAAQNIGGRHVKVLIWDNRFKQYYLVNLEAWDEDAAGGQTSTTDTE